MLTNRLISQHIRFRPAITTQRHHAAHYSETARRPRIVEEEDYIERFWADHRNLVILDKAQLAVTYHMYDSMEKIVREVGAEDVRVETAGPHEYINYTSIANVTNRRRQSLEALARLKLHIKDLQTEPYLEYDFDFAKVTRTPAELEELGIETAEFKDKYKTMARRVNKYSVMINEGTRRKDRDSGFKLVDFLQEEIGRIDSEEAGVEFPDRKQRPLFGQSTYRLVIPVSEPEPEPEPESEPELETRVSEVKSPVKVKRPRFGSADRSGPGEKRILLHPDQMPSTKSDQEPAAFGEFKRGAPKGRDSQKSVSKQVGQSDGFSDFPMEDMDITDHEALMEEDRKRR